MNRRGVTLVELMVAVSITGILSLFSFDSVRRVITASMTVQNKADFETLVTSVHYLLGRLDQCTCNFLGANWATGSTTLTTPPTFGSLTALYSYNVITWPKPPLNYPPNNPSCGTAPPTIVVANGLQPPGYTATVVSVGITNIQYIQSMNVARALYQMQISVPQQVDQTTVMITREVPLLFSTDPTDHHIVGCIGMSR